MKVKYLLTIDGDAVAIDGSFKKLHKLAATALKNGKWLVANITNESKQCNFFLYWTPTKGYLKRKEIKMSRPPLDETLRFGATKVQFRIPEDDWEVFKAVAGRYNRVPAKVLRELVSWYVATKKCIHGVPVHRETTCQNCRCITEANQK